MSGKEVHEISERPVTCFSFNKDRTRLAFSANDHNVLIYKKNGAKWVEECVLEEHHQNVTSIDWAPNSNRIVTCSADRNGFVWVEEDGKWRPTLVILRINRAATYVRWSPKEDKFAVASGARLISICYFESENKWWVSKHIKKPIRSTVLSLDWHPNNYLLAASSSDFKARVFSAYIKDIEEKPSATEWGKKMPFGNLMAEYSNGTGGWLHDVVFSPSGSKIAWVGHDSSISVVQAGEGNEVCTLNTNGLPMKTCIFLTENTLVAAGYDFVPMVFAHDPATNKVSFLAKLDEPAQKGDEEETMSAMERFRNLDKKASGSKQAKSSTTHSNAIVQLSFYSGTREEVAKISSAGLDGRIVLWDVKSLERAIEGLTIA